MQRCLRHCEYFERVDWVSIDESELDDFLQLISILKSVKSQVFSHRKYKHHFRRLSRLDDGTDICDLMFPVDFFILKYVNMLCCHYKFAV